MSVRTIFFGSFLSFSGELMAKGDRNGVECVQKENHIPSFSHYDFYGAFPSNLCV